MNRAEAEEARHPRGDDPRPEDELDEAVDEEDADLPILGRPNSPAPPSDKGRPEPMIFEAMIDPNPEDSLRLPFDTLSLFASHDELLNPPLLPANTDDPVITGPEVAAAIPSLKLSLSTEGVGEAGPPKLGTIEESPIVELVVRASCTTACSISP